MDIDQEIEAKIIAPMKKYEIWSLSTGCSIAGVTPFIAYFCLRELAGTSIGISFLLAMVSTFAIGIILAYISSLLDSCLFSLMNRYFESSFPDDTPLHREAMMSIYRQKDKCAEFKRWVRKKFREG